MSVYAMLATPGLWRSWKVLANRPLNCHQTLHSKRESVETKFISVSDRYIILFDLLFNSSDYNTNLMAVVHIWRPQFKFEDCNLHLKPTCWTWSEKDVDHFGQKSRSLIFLIIDPVFHFRSSTKLNWIIDPSSAWPLNKSMISPKL